MATLLAQPIFAPPARTGCTPRSLDAGPSAAMAATVRPPIDSTENRSRRSSSFAEAEPPCRRRGSVVTSFAQRGLLRASLRGEEAPPASHQASSRRWTESLLLLRLPQFDFVAVRIVDPGESAVAFVLALRVDADAFFRQAIEQCVEVVNDVVQHERG